MAEIIAVHQSGATARPTPQQMAACAMDDMKRIRAGLDPLPMTADERQAIVDRCARKDRPPADAETTAKVTAILSGKPAAELDDHDARVRANVVRLLKR